MVKNFDEILSQSNFVKPAFDELSNVGVLEINIDKSNRISSFEVNYTNENLSFSYQYDKKTFSYKRTKPDSPYHVSNDTGSRVEFPPNVIKQSDLKTFLSDVARQQGMGFEVLLVNKGNDITRQINNSPQLESYILGAIGAKNVDGQPTFKGPRKLEKDVEDLYPLGELGSKPRQR